MMSYEFAATNSASSSASPTSNSSASPSSTSGCSVSKCDKFQKMIIFDRALQSGDSSPNNTTKNVRRCRLRTISTASRAFLEPAVPAKQIPSEYSNDFYLFQMRRRNSASVAPQSTFNFAAYSKTARYVPSAVVAQSAAMTMTTSNTVAARLHTIGQKGEMSSIQKNNNGNAENAFDDYGIALERDHRYDSSQGIVRARVRRESRLRQEDACALALAARIGGCASRCFARSSSASSYTSASSSSSPSCGSSSNSSTSTHITLASGAKSAIATGRTDDRNHPNEKIVKHAEGVGHVSSRNAFYRLYEFGGLVGQGNFSNVNVVYAENTGVKYAVKEIDKKRMNGKAYFVENEIAILKRCSHRNICHLFSAFQSDDFYFLVFEYAPKGDLFETIKRMSRLSEKTAAQITFQIGSALSYLHARRVVHRDVKPENILLGTQLTAKLTDFGLACTVVGPLYRVCGTPTYVAPEILSQDGYGVEVDIWSLGVLLYVMLVGFAPFRSPDRAHLFRLIVGARISFDMPSWSRISLRAKKLILRMLTNKVAIRIRAVDLLDDMWIRVHNDARNERDELQ